MQPVRPVARGLLPQQVRLTDPPHQGSTQVRVELVRLRLPLLRAPVGQLQQQQVAGLLGSSLQALQPCQLPVQDSRTQCCWHKPRRQLKLPRLPGRPQQQRVQLLQRQSLQLLLLSLWVV